ncbi:MAG: SMP-30/gluconolactonase/LRE family protein [Actinomycetota bacterium]|nr:SMP-30/gluconolactonase/LRE family protein [Actinomycetota bacterium]
MSWFGPASILGECPRWDDRSQRLHWVDIDGGTLHEAQLTGGGWSTAQHPVATPLAGAVLLDDPAKQTWLVAVSGSLAPWTVTGGLGALRVVERKSDSCPVRLNEVVTDPIGRLWVGSMAYDWTVGAGAFFRIDLDGSVHRVLDGITVANGVGWSPDGTTMYSTDTGPARITAWDYDLDTGAVSRPRPFRDSTSDAGRPDGLAVDTDGNVWSAFAGGFRVCCFDTAGREIERVRVPAPDPTSCCFAGPNRDRLVITTGRKRLPREVLDKHPDSGRLWDAGVVGARGLPQVRTRVQLEQSSEADRNDH